ncbi:hypothetical protein B0H17DRAFT_1124008 [Mycena rosella]|uniref:Uncharacterized protein n=1 Tax=Mycena rosella TaxID=1033263 RepID=A0AAD7MDC2_MYCRO|nr:hypothetical protein B0H17DRAFT_1124008 [Mycena rosella]
MGANFKSKKRKDFGAYGGNEQLGKRARSDARGDNSISDVTAPPPSALAAVSSTQADSTTSNSYYCPCSHIPELPAAPSSSMPKPAPCPNHEKPFDVETFDLADNTALERLNNNQLRSLCIKYEVDTARSKENNIKNLQDYYGLSQRCRVAVQPASSMPYYYYYPATYYSPLYYTQLGTR